MELIASFVAGALLGFAAGFLVFRKNQNKLNKIEKSFRDS